MAILDPSDDYAEVRIGADLLEANGFTKNELHEISAWLGSFLADPMITTADVKGLLNRNMGKYNPLDVGGRPLLEALAQQLRTIV